MASDPVRDTGIPDFCHIVVSEGRAVTLAVSGDVDLQTSDPLRDCLLGLINAGYHDVDVDLTKLEFIDSTGMGALVSVLKRCRATGGTLRLSNASEPVRKVLVIAGLDRVFDLDGDSPT